jgi:hypothetical protein
VEAKNEEPRRDLWHWLEENYFRMLLVLPQLADRRRRQRLANPSEREHSC